jgi:hypothetical protein
MEKEISPRGLAIASSNPDKNTEKMNFGQITPTGYLRRLFPQID